MYRLAIVGLPCLIAALLLWPESKAIPPSEHVSEQARSSSNEITPMAGFKPITADDPAIDDPINYWATPLGWLTVGIALGCLILVFWLRKEGYFI